MRWNMGAFFCIEERKKLSLQEMQMNTQCFTNEALTAWEGDGVLIFAVRDQGGRYAYLVITKHQPVPPSLSLSCISCSWLHIWLGHGRKQ